MSSRQSHDALRHLLLWIFSQGRAIHNDRDRRSGLINSSLNHLSISGGHSGDAPARDHDAVHR